MSIDNENIQNSKYNDGKIKEVNIETRVSSRTSQIRRISQNSFRKEGNKTPLNDEPDSSDNKKFESKDSKDIIVPGNANNDNDLTENQMDPNINFTM